MNNNKTRLTNPQQSNHKQLPQLQRISLEQLDSVWGGTSVGGERFKLPPSPYPCKDKH